MEKMKKISITLLILAIFFLFLLLSHGPGQNYEKDFLFAQFFLYFFVMIPLISSLIMLILYFMAKKIIIPYFKIWTE